MATPVISFILVALTMMTFTFSQESTPTLTFRIPEESKSGLMVGRLSDISLDIPSGEDATMLRYSFLTDDYLQYFSLQDTSGDLFTMVKIDRENICHSFPTTPKCELIIKFAAKTSGSFFQTIVVKIVIEDLNDNAPLFPENHIVLNISEGVMVNTRFGIASADDPDTGENNGIQSYEINPSSEAFELSNEKKLDGTFNVELIVKQILDREKQDSYIVRIVAKDGGNPEKTGVVNVDIVVTDMNDNKPVFDKASYNISVEEGTARGTSVLTIHAVDDDTGDNGRISYRINDQYDPILNDFSINVTSGTITVVKEKLAFQPNVHYTFIVDANDNGDEPYVSQVFVYIYVTDTGNNPPKVKLRLLSPGNIGFVDVLENSQNGSFVAHVTVEDSDTGANGKVTCSVSNNYFRVDELNEKGAFKVVVSNSLNREVLDLHNVTVTCSDHGDPRLSSSVSFLVRVTDYNDNKPMFKSLNYLAKIPENMDRDQIILQVSASDKDDGINQQIHYVIRNQPLLVVNNITGVITAVPFFDRERTPIIVFEVLAIDAGIIPLTGTATVTLNIEDVNDNAPEFTQIIYEFEILENLNSGTTVNSVNASDNDTSTNGMFSFLLSPDYVNSKIPFHIFSDGVIQSDRALDREEQSIYEFDVIVTDQGSPAKTSTASVTIIVKDVNDNHPNITFPTKDNKTVSVYYPTVELQTVADIEAHDIDAGENRTLHYSIEKGNELGLFKIDEITGLITIADNKIVINENIAIAVLIEVHDAGAISLASTAELIVNVIYTNATFTDTTAEENRKFVVIVVVVVVVTIILSAVIIGLIFILKTMDRKKSIPENQNHVDQNGFANRQTIYLMNNTGESSTDYVVANSDGVRKKKEVSFSLDDHDSISNYQHYELQVNMVADPIQYVPDKPPRLEKTDSTQDLYDKVTTRLENLKLQSMLQMAKQQQQQHVPHVNPDDSRSESSGETSSRDSGRGASEEEVASASPSHGTCKDDQKTFDYAVPVKIQTSTVQNNFVPSSRADNYSAVPPPIPCRTYKPYGSFNSNQSYSKNHRQYLSVPSYHSDLSVLDPSVLAWQHNQPYSHPPIKTNDSVAQSDLAYFLALDARYRKRSQDDDDCSTTTSGSYTLHSVEDLL